MKDTKQWINIDGSVEVDVDHDKFSTEFLLWLTQKGWQFAGVTIPADEDEE